MKKLLTILTVLIAILIIGHWPNSNAKSIPHLQGEVKGKTKGKVSRGKYTSPDKDFTIAIPRLVQPGATIQDQADRAGVAVVFTDGLGFLYQIVSLKNDSGELSIENAARGFNNILENIRMKTERGDEVRIVDIEKEGSFLLVKTVKNKANDEIEREERRPDLLAASALFEANNRLYMIRAGMSLLWKGSDESKDIETVKNRLESFIAGLELLSRKK